MNVDNYNISRYVWMSQNSGCLGHSSSGRGGMVQTTLAPDRLHSLRSVYYLARVLLGSLLLLPSLTLGPGPSAADETPEEPAATRPDFRSAPPRVILGLRGGWASNRSNGEIYDFLTGNLTLHDSDFDPGVFAMDVAVRATLWLDLVFGFEVSGNYQKSEFRKFKEEQSGAPIEQKTRLTQIPLTFSVKLYPFGRGRQVGNYAWIRSTLVPYLGGGIGGTYYQLKQKGDFVVTDPTDPFFLDIFEAKIESDEWAFAQHAFVGFDIKLTRNFGLVLEGRYYWASADLEDDFVDFDSIDLDGARVMAGLSWRL